MTAGRGFRDVLPSGHDAPYPSPVVSSFFEVGREDDWQSSTREEFFFTFLNCLLESPSCSCINFFEHMTWSRGFRRFLFWRITGYGDGGDGVHSVLDEMTTTTATDTVTANVVAYWRERLFRQSCNLVSSREPAVEKHLSSCKQVALVIFQKVIVAWLSRSYF